jgi:O-antigen/teichoic acid export membrane protein
MKDSQNKLVTDTLILTCAGYFGQFLSIIRGFIVAKFLDPKIYGYFSGFSLIEFYCAQGHLGILHGMNKSISIKRGERDVTGYENIKNSAFNSIIFLALLISLAIVIFSLIKEGSYSHYFLWGIRVFGLAVILQQLEMVYHSVLRAEYRMNIISISRVLFSVSNISLVIILINNLGFYGVLLAYFFAYVVSNVFLIVKSKIKFKVYFDMSLIMSLVRIGLPISIIFLVEVLLKSVDRIMIIRYLDIIQLGYYGIALTICEAMSRIPNTIIYSYFPKILEKWGAHKEISVLKTSFEMPSVIIGLIVSFCTGVAFLFVGILISGFLPEYRPAINASRILLFSVFFMSLSQMALRILIAINKNRLMIFFQLIVILFSIILNLIFLKLGYGIIGIAIGTTISYIIYTVGVLTYTFSFFYRNILSIIWNQLLLYMPILFCILLLALIAIVYPGIFKISSGLRQDYRKIIMPMSILIVGFIPFLYIMIFKYRNAIAIPFLYPGKFCRK